MELDAQTLSVLQGTNKPRNTEPYEVDGARYRVITSVGRSLRTVPPFSMDEVQLKAVVVAVATSYIFRNKTVPKDWVPAFETLDDQAGDWLATIRAIAYC